MEAALVASQRGHNVILYEKENRVGGKMVFASIPQFKSVIGKLLQYYESNLEKSGVEVRLGQKINLDKLSAENPEVIIVAVGADIVVPMIPGIKKENVLTVLDLFKNKKLEIGKQIVVIGAGLIGCETSWYLASQGKLVKVVDILSRDAILSDEHDSNRSMLMINMGKEGVNILGKREIIRIENEGVVAKRENGTEEFLHTDNVILATGFKPKTKLRDVFSRSSLNAQIYFVGDCVEPRKFYEAIHEGSDVAWKI